MNAKILRATAVTLLAGVAIIGAGCVRVTMPEPEYSASARSVQLGTAEEVRASIEMGAGVLNVSGGATELMDARFDFSDDTWEPAVDYQVTEGKGELSVTTPAALHLGLGRGMRYEWDIKLGEDIPLDLLINMGAGESSIDLSGLDVRRLQADVGAGESAIDLSGDRTHDLAASIMAGVGRLTLRVPKNLGVRIVGLQDGLGDYQADGFKHDGAALVNDAYDTADVKLDITVQRGIGDVIVEMVQ